MGVKNVGAVFSRWYALPHLPFRLLLYMAMRSMDGASPPIYYAGWEELALAAGRFVPEQVDGDKENAKERRAALVAVTTAVKCLTDNGAVKVVHKGAPGRNATYAIMLDAATVQAQPEPNTSGPPCTVQGDHRSNSAGSADNSAGSPCTTVQDQPAPEEQLQEQEKEQAAATAPTTARHRGGNGIAAAAEMILNHKPMPTADAEAIAEAINTAKKPRNLPGLVKHLADAGELDAWIEQASGAKQPPWCGACDEPTRKVVKQINGRDQVIRCANCHPQEAPAMPARRSGGYQPWQNPKDPDTYYASWTKTRTGPYRDPVGVDGDDWFKGL